MWKPTRFLVERGRGAHSCLVAVVEWDPGYRQYMPLVHFETRAEAEAYVEHALAETA